MKSRINKFTRKYGLEVPRNVTHTYAIEKRGGEYTLGKCDKEINDKC